MIVKLTKLQIELLIKAIANMGHNPAGNGYIAKCNCCKLAKKLARAVNQ